MKVRVWKGGADGTFQAFDVPRVANQTALHVVTHIQRVLGLTLAYRYACHLGLCSSCAVAVGLALALALT